VDDGTATVHTMAPGWGFLHSHQCEETVMDMIIGMLLIAFAVYMGAYEISKALNRIADIADKVNS
jgi:hypothetical protein